MLSCENNLKHKVRSALSASVMRVIGPILNPEDPNTAFSETARAKAAALQKAFACS